MPLLDPATATLMPTPMAGFTIPYWVKYPDGYTYTRSDKDGQAGRMRCYVRWYDQELFQVYAEGFTQGPAAPGGTGISGYTFRRFTPLRWPRQWSGRSNMWATDVAYLSCGMLHETSGAPRSHFPDPYGNPDGLGQGWFAADYAELEVAFAERHVYHLWTDAELAGFFSLNPNLPVSEVYRYVEKRSRSVPKERKVASRGFATYDPAAPAVVKTVLSETAFVPFAEVEWSYVWHQVPLEWVPHQAIRDCSLRVNAAPTPDPGDPDNRFDRRFKPGTLRFNGLAETITPYRRSDGNLYADLAYSFTEQPNGWNFVPDIDPAAPWVPISRLDSTGGFFTPKVPLYASDDFHKLFRPPASPTDPWI